MSQRFQNTLQSPAKTSRDHQGPQQVWGSQQGGFDAAMGKVPSRAAQGKRQNSILEFPVPAAELDTSLNFSLLHPWDFHGERKKGVKPKQGSPTGSLSPLPHLSQLWILQWITRNSQAGRVGRTISLSFSPGVGLGLSH